MQRFRTCLACIAILISGAASAYTSPPFPRLAVSWISNHLYGETTVQQQLARADIAIILTWPGWSANGTGIEQPLKNIKAINPNILIFEYTKENEIDGTPPGSGAYIAQFNKLNTMHWYLYPTGSSGTPLPSSFSGATSINNTVFTKPDSNGDNWLSWDAKWVVTTLYAPAPSFDGFSVDNTFTRTWVSGDWNLDGVDDPARSSLAGQWQRQGNAYFFDELHSLMPGKYQIGNINNWVFYQ